ncbi:hypothetical protein LIER_34305 [Lithospermum erythrorhizon]|uniref:Uncharacterized protein n=1 Tax=Lithospermum erythrorhizon TaxID=34254 RepID=A0AAV3S2V1_LITER
MAWDRGNTRNPEEGTWLLSRFDKADKDPDGGGDQVSGNRWAPRPECLGERASSMALSRVGFGDKTHVTALAEVEGEASGDGQAYFTPSTTFALLGGGDNLLIVRLECALSKRKRFLYEVKEISRRELR